MKTKLLTLLSLLLVLCCVTSCTSSPSQEETTADVDQTVVDSQAEDTPSDTEVAEPEESSEELETSFSPAMDELIEARNNTDYTVLVDAALSEYDPPMLIDSLHISTDGVTELLLTGALAESYGETFKVCDDAVIGNTFLYGNGGMSVLLFIREDGTITVINPMMVYYNKEIQVVENFGDLQRIVKIESVEEEGAVCLNATDCDGNSYWLDEYLVELPY